MINNPHLDAWIVRSKQRNRPAFGRFLLVLKNDEIEVIDGRNVS
jgi:hypothetical protein